MFLVPPPSYTPTSFDLTCSLFCMSSIVISGESRIVADGSGEDLAEYQHPGISSGRPRNSRPPHRHRAQVNGEEVVQALFIPSVYICVCFFP